MNNKRGFVRAYAYSVHHQCYAVEFSHDDKNMLDDCDRLPTRSPFIEYEISIARNTIRHVRAMKDLLPVLTMHTIQLQMSVDFSKVCAATGIGINDMLTTELRDRVAEALITAGRDEDANTFMRWLPDNYFRLREMMTMAKGAPQRLLMAFYWAGSASELMSHVNHPLFRLMLKPKSESEIWRLAFVNTVSPTKTPLPLQSEPRLKWLDFNDRATWGHPTWFTRDLYYHYKSLFNLASDTGHLCISYSDQDPNIQVLEHQRLVRTVNTTESYFTFPFYDQVTLFLAAFIRARPETKFFHSPVGDFHHLRTLLDEDNALRVVVIVNEARQVPETRAELGITRVTDLYHPTAYPLGEDETCVFYGAHDFDIVALARALDALHPDRLWFVGSDAFAPPDSARGASFKDIVRVCGPAKGKLEINVFTQFRSNYQARVEWSKEVCDIFHENGDSMHAYFGQSVDYMREPESHLYTASFDRATRVTNHNSVLTKGSWVCVRYSDTIHATMRMFITQVVSFQVLGFDNHFYVQLKDDPIEDHTACCGNKEFCDTAIHPFVFIHCIPIALVPTSLRVDHVVLEINREHTCLADIQRAATCARKTCSFYIEDTLSEDEARAILTNACSRTGIRTAHITDAHLIKTSSESASEEEQKPKIDPKEFLNSTKRSKR